MLSALLERPHPLSNLTLDCPYTAALLGALNIVGNDVSLACDTPLRLSLALNPPHGLNGTSTAAALDLVVTLRVSGACPEDLPYLLHAHICCESWAIAVVELGVALSIIVLVLWQLGPEPSENAVSNSRDVVRGRALWSLVKGAQDELRRLHLAQVLVEELLPWCFGKRRGCGCGCRHCA